MKLYTKTGDDGTTGLFGGDRVQKCDPRVSAYGEVDELNAALGCSIAAGPSAGVKKQLAEIQSDLFDLGAELATPQGKTQSQRVTQAAIARLEGWIDEASNAVPALRNFVLPGGTAAAAQLHFSRAVCRRAERAVVGLAQSSQVDPRLVIYLNRLSDLLFALARLENHGSGVADIPWIPSAR